MTYPSFDLTALTETPGIEMFFLSPGDPVRAQELDDADALILLSEQFSADSIPASDRLSVVARFGVGYDTVVLAWPAIELAKMKFS